MKKAILCAAALMFGTMAFAQVSGAPTASAVPALPGAAAGANTGESIQNGNDNKVRVRQAGTSQSVYTNQNDGSGSGGNLAAVQQTGLVNPTSGIANLAEVLQSGSANQSTTLQEGDYNNAVTRQGQNDDSSARNKALIRQGTGQQAENNHAAIEQDGDDNLARTQQTYDNSDAWTRQVGDENKSMIVQNAGPNGSDGHEANVEQYGDRNESAVDQDGFPGQGGRNVATTYQLGDDNQAKQKQKTTAASGVAGNRGSIVQGPGPYDVLIGAANSDAGSIYAAWPGGVAGSPTLESIGAKAKQTQYGKMNEAAIRQIGGTVGASNYGEQEQLSGWNNDAALYQGHFFAGEDDNYGKQSQAGDNNDAGLVQSGSGMKGLQTQYGHRNDAASVQVGEDHRLNVHQRGNDNVAETGQAGSGNAALLTQRDGQSYSIAQNLNLGWLDRSQGGNQADVLQLGPNGDFSADYIDCDFDPPMNLDMNYNIPDLIIDDVCPDC